MSFLDNNGLSTFYNNLKKQFPQKVEGVSPDTNGNITIPNLVKFSSQTLTSAQQQQAQTNIGIDSLLTTIPNLTIIVNDWNGGTTCTKTGLTGVTEDNNIIINPAPSSYTTFVESVVRATAQGNGSITFTCDSTPSSPITLTILILNKCGILV